MYTKILVAVENAATDRAVLDHIESLARLCAARLAMGDPATKLVKVAADEDVDLIAMSTHGHRFLQDLLRGSTADRVRHEVTVPMLLVRAT
jgi:manganese transport protein